MLARRQGAGRLIPATDIGTTVPTNSLTNWFSERMHRLYTMTGGE
jgi:hypothetical protein